MAEVGVVGMDFDLLFNGEGGDGGVAEEDDADFGGVEGAPS